MQTGGISTASSRQTGVPARGAAAEPASRALVVMAPSPAYRQIPEHYRQAAFLAHLIAVKDQLPQTRQRRRAEPGEAIAAYRAAGALVQ